MRALLSRPIFLCSQTNSNKNNNSNNSKKFITKQKLINLKKDLELKIKDKESVASECCNDVIFLEYNYYCFTLLNQIKTLKQKKLHVDFYLRYFENEKEE